MRIEGEQTQQDTLQNMIKEAISTDIVRVFATQDRTGRSRSRDLSKKNGSRPNSRENYNYDRNRHRISRRDDFDRNQLRTPRRNDRNRSWSRCKIPIVFCVDYYDYT